MPHEALEGLGEGTRFKIIKGKKVRLVKEFTGNGRTYKWVLPDKYRRRSAEQVFQGGLGE